MSNLYRQVLCSERLPKIDSSYLTDCGKLRYYVSIDEWVNGNPFFWLEELPIQPGMSLQECKDMVAKERGYNDWGHFESNRISAARWHGEGANIITIAIQQLLHATSEAAEMYKFSHTEKLREELAYEIKVAEGQLGVSKELQEENQRLRDKIKENNLSFDLYHDAVQRGTEKYRELYLDFPKNSLPDLAKMVEGLCEKVQQAIALVEALKRIKGGYRNEEECLSWDEIVIKTAESALSSFNADKQKGA
jgi:hypothetical protein